MSEAPSVRISVFARMLNLILVVLSLIAIPAGAQVQRPGGFADIPWGTKIDEARKVMSSKQGVQSGKDTTASRLEFQGGTFAGKPALVWGLEFVDAGFYRGAVVLKAFGERSKEFDEVKAMLTQKYGLPVSSSRKGKDSKAIWKFPADLKNKETEIIVLWNNPREGGLKITYRNESMKVGDTSDEL